MLLKERLETFRRLKDQGETYSAITRLAEIFHCLRWLESRYDAIGEFQSKAVG
jgi:hypothetical protein